MMPFLRFCRLSRRHLRLGRALSIIGLALASLPLQAGQPSPSEAILAGLVVPQRSADYPATLELPDNWLPLLKKLSRESAGNPHEVASCISLTAGKGGSPELQEALTAQGQEVERPGARSDDSRQAAADLRALLAQRGNTLALTPGGLQSGAEASIMTRCQGAMVGMFHTHPADVHSSEALSDRDAHGAVSGGLAFSGVVYGDRSCIELRGGGHRLKLEASNIAYFTDLTYAAWLSHDKAETYPLGLARFAEDNGGALYCGPIGRSLPRVPAPTLDWRQPGAQERLLLATKAWIIALKAREHPEWPRVDFVFGPSLDPAFRAYLHRIWPASAPALAEALMDRPDQVPALFRAVLTALPAREPVSWSAGFVLPDERFAQQNPPFFSFACEDAACGLVLSERGLNRHLSVDLPQTLYWRNGGFMAGPTQAADETDPEVLRQHMALRCKAWVLALKLREHPDWPAINYAFTPTLDDAFWRYLQRVYPAQGTGSLMELMMQKDQPDQVFAALKQQLPSHAHISWVHDLDVPGSDPEHSQPLYMMVCDKQGCQLQESSERAYFSKSPGLVRAYYNRDGANGVIDEVRGRPHLSASNGKSHFYRGDTVWNSEYGWQETGAGITEAAEYRYVGHFDAGRPVGEGMFFSRKEGVWHHAHADNGAINFDQQASAAPTNLDQL